MENLTYDKLKPQFYRNTREVFGCLNVTDMAIAAVLGGLNLLLVGDAGTGKSQFVKDIYNSYFGGNKAENGQGVCIRGRPELDIYSEIFIDAAIAADPRVKEASTRDISQKIIEANKKISAIAKNPDYGILRELGNNKPHILVVGHYHRLDAFSESGMNAYLAGTTQNQTEYMRERNIRAELGGLLLEISLDGSGRIECINSRNIAYRQN